MVRTFVFVLFMTLSGLIRAASAYTVYDLRCAHLTGTPVGVSCSAPAFSWKLNSTVRGTLQQACQIVVAESAAGLNNPDSAVWNSGRMDTRRTSDIVYAGRTLKPATRYYWSVRSWNNRDEASPWSRPASFITGLDTPADWGRARWIALEKDRRHIVPAIHVVDIKKRLAPDDKPGMYQLPQFRKVVNVRKPLSSAVACISGLGQFDFYIGGRKVGDHFLDPGWRRYDKEAQYVGFDVTSMLQQGKNVLGVMLGNGFYNIPRERYTKILQTYGAPKLLFCLVLRYTDGTEERVVSDKSWRVTASPVTFSSIYGGESYDATLETAGWNSDAGYNDSRWKRAIEVNNEIKLSAQLGTELKVRQTIPAVRLIQNAAGRPVYDLGQNFSGIVRIKVKGPRGARIRLVPAEILNKDNTPNQRASGSPYYFEYTLRGDGEEEWQPQFTYYGFRYVQVEGAVPAGKENGEHQPEIISLTGLHTTSGNNDAGEFSCSEPLFNKIYTLIDWAMRSNMSSVLTDCPHREKLGWLEQYYLMQNSLQYRYDMQPMYDKVLEDMAASQLANGAIPTIAPEYVRFEGGFGDTPEWGSAFIVCPWYVYKTYGDSRLIRKYYAAMQRYLDYLSGKSDGHIISYGLGDWFDIGPAKPGKAQLTSNALTATATYYYDTVLMERMARLLGKDADATRYAALAKAIREAYNTRFFNAAAHTYEHGSQTANAISLYTGLVDKEEEPGVLASLIADISSRGFALTAGDIGYRYVLRVLEKYGRSDIIYAMNSRYDVPGYGWQLAHGATALTESWQAYESVSNNHFMLGHLMEWLFSGLGGIRQSEESTAFDEVLIDPQPSGTVTSAQTTCRSVHGDITVCWKLTKEKYTLRVNIPANSTALIVLPSADAGRITDYGLPVTQSEGVKLSGVSGGKSIWETGSGSYLFEVALQANAASHKR